MNKTSAPVEHGISEFDVAGLTPVPRRYVSQGVKGGGPMIVRNALFAEN